MLVVVLVKGAIRVRVSGLHNALVLLVAPSIVFVVDELIYFLHLVGRHQTIHHDGLQIDVVLLNYLVH